MKQKDLKIDFRYLGRNIACLSVDSISGESVHNDINNEEAIIIFNSLVGEKADCQTVKSLLKENQELKKQVEEKKMLIKQCDLSISKVMDCYCERTDCSGRIKDSKQYDSLVQKVETQQKEFINYLDDEIHTIETTYSQINGNYGLMNEKLETLKEILQKYKETIEDDINGTN